MDEPQNMDDVYQTRGEYFAQNGFNDTQTEDDFATVQLQQEMARQKAVDDRINQFMLLGKNRDLQEQKATQDINIAGTAALLDCYSRPNGMSSVGMSDALGMAIGNGVCGFQVLNGLQGDDAKYNGTVAILGKVKGPDGNVTVKRVGALNQFQQYAMLQKSGGGTEVNAAKDRLWGKMTQSFTPEQLESMGLRRPNSEGSTTIPGQAARLLFGRPRQRSSTSAFSSDGKGNAWTSYSGPETNWQVDRRQTMRDGVALDENSMSNEEYAVYKQNMKMRDDAMRDLNNVRRDINMIDSELTHNNLDPEYRKNLEAQRERAIDREAMLAASASSYGGASGRRGTSGSGDAYPSNGISNVLSERNKMAIAKLNAEQREKLADMANEMKKYGIDVGFDAALAKASGRGSSSGAYDKNAQALLNSYDKEVEGINKRINEIVDKDEKAAAIKRRDSILKKIDAIRSRMSGDESVDSPEPEEGAIDPKDPMALRKDGQGRINPQGVGSGGAPRPAPVRKNGNAQSVSTPGPDKTEAPAKTKTKQAVAPATSNKQDKSKSQELREKNGRAKPDKNEQTGTIYSPRLVNDNNGSRIEIDSTPTHGQRQSVLGGGSSMDAIRKYKQDEDAKARKEKSRAEKADKLDKWIDNELGDSERLIDERQVKHNLRNNPRMTIADLKRQDREAIDFDKWIYSELDDAERIRTNDKKSTGKKKKSS